ncbi:hypothetical protein [Pleionea sp. CnH1-48]|uniref:hypothetical protein n=1 Tax=Pleionea sp. CnH1-48 TaxID=2954494 RepID=UPI0020969D97|nr:hypothetical protein [Pleionea sp. CnH1-48]MCO7227474.1 hypothetical protein [Pleionea sp. CnH1-48]
MTFKNLMMSTLVSILFASQPLLASNTTVESVDDILESMESLKGDDDFTNELIFVKHMFDDANHKFHKNDGEVRDIARQMMVNTSLVTIEKMREAVNMQLSGAVVMPITEQGFILLSGLIDTSIKRLQEDFQQSGFDLKNLQALYQLATAKSVVTKTQFFMNYDQNVTLNFMAFMNWLVDNNVAYDLTVFKNGMAGELIEEVGEDYIEYLLGANYVMSN